MMKVLYLSRWFPYPADNGAKKRIYHLIEALSKAHTVDLISFTAAPVSEENLRVLSRICRTIDPFVYRPFQPKRMSAILGAFANRPRFLVDTYRPELAALVQSKNEQTGYDLIIASELDMFPYVEAIAGPAILLEELEISQYIDRITQSTSAPASFFSRLTWWKLKTYLQALLPRAGGCTTVSAKEKQLVQQYIGKNISINVIPNGATSRPPLLNLQPPVPDTLIYAGALTYKANYDAVDFFIHNVFPRIRAKRPNVQFTVTGSLAGVDISRLTDVEGVHFAGYLDNITDAITGSWVSVVPLRVGGGTRLKILESLSLGTPVISTCKGMEGLDLVPGEEILVSDDPQEFADHVVRVLDSEALRTSLGQAGRRAVEEKYDWQKIGEVFSGYAEMLASQKTLAHGRKQ